MKKPMSFFKKILLIALSLIFVFAFISANVQADSAAIYSLDINVELMDNGGARITEVWDVNVTSGTEWYLVVGNLGDSDISDFSVSENGNAFRNIGEWDIDRTIEQKKNQCGIVDTGDGYELCWGVGSYGKHTFTVSYNVTNMIKSYADYDGFNWRFVNDELSSNVEKLNVRLYKEGTPFVAESTKVWAFGYEGEIHVNENGQIEAFGNDELNYRDYCNIMVRFDKGIFTPASIRNESFDDALLIRAFEGSEYSYDEYINGGNYYGADENYDYYYDYDSDYDPIPDWVFAVIIFLAIFVPILIMTIVIIILVKAFSGVSSELGSIKGAKITKREYENIGWNRDIPFDGNLEATYFAFLQSGRSKGDNSLIGSYILRWLQNGYIEIKETERKRFLGLGEKMEASIIFLKDNTVLKEMNETEKRLYTLMLRASGGDKILQEKEFYEYSKDHYESVFGWLKSVERAGRNKIQNMGGLSVVRKKVFFGSIDKKETIFNEEGHNMVLRTLGFKKYLEDFTLINERKPKEVELWNDYLVFAVLYGIADKVSEEFRELYPKYFEDLNNIKYYSNDYYYTMRMIDSISKAAHRGANSGRSADSDSGGGFSSGGGGGFSSGGGGGGFSGGGSGGGSR